MVWPFSPLCPDILFPAPALGPDGMGPVPRGKGTDMGGTHTGFFIGRVLGTQ